MGAAARSGEKCAVSAHSRTALGIELHPAFLCSRTLPSCATNLPPPTTADAAVGLVQDLWAAHVASPKLASALRSLNAALTAALNGAFLGSAVGGTAVKVPADGDVVALVDGVATALLSAEDTPAMVLTAADSPVPGAW